MGDKVGLWALAPRLKVHGPGDMGPMVTFFQDYYANSEAHEHTDWNALATEGYGLRKKALTPSVFTENCIENLVEYHQFVLAAQRRCQHARVTFEWPDLYENASSKGFFSKAPPKKVGGWKYEGACTRYQIGMIRMHMASSIMDLTNQESLVQAGKMYKEAFNIFHNLREVTVDLLPGVDFPNDMSGRYVQALQACALAQYTLCFATNAALSGKSKGIVQKVNLSAIVSSRRAADACSGTVAQWLPGWSDALASRAGIMESRLYMQKAKELNSEGQYGQSVAAASMACGLVQRLQTSQSSRLVQSPEIISTIQQTLAEASALFNEYNSDNKSVYFERVPEVSAIAIKDEPAAIKAAAQFEELQGPLRKLFVPNGPDSLMNVPDQEQQEQQDDWKALMDELKSRVQEEVEARNQAIQDEFRRQQLPGIFMQGAAENPLPVETRNNIDVINKEHGGVMALSTELLEDVRKGAREYLASCQNELKNDELQDRIFRQKAGDDAWNKARKSSPLFEELKSRIGKFEQAFNEAEAKDAQLEARVKQLKGTAGFNLLSLSLKELDSKARSFAQAKNVENSAVQEAVKAEYEALNAIVKRRETILMDMISACSQPERFYLTLPTIKYEGEIQELTDMRNKESGKLTSLQDACEQFRKANASAACSEERSQFLSDLAEASNRFITLMREVGNVVIYYTRMQDKARALRRECEDFVLARKHEGEELVQGMQGLAVNNEPKRGASPPPSYDQI